MGWQAFVASLVHSLAWPAGVVTVVVFLRKPIRAVLSQALLRRLKAGPLEVEFDQIQAEVREDLARSPELTEAQVPAPASQAALPGSSLREDCPRSPSFHQPLRSGRRLSGSRSGWQKCSIIPAIRPDVSCPSGQWLSWHSNAV